MRYRLKKEHPFGKVGTIWEKTGETTLLEPDAIQMKLEQSKELYQYFPKSTFSEWFEPVDERWRPGKFGGEYWVVTSRGEVLDVTWSGDGHDKAMFELGNICQTREQAQELARRWKEVALAYQKELSEGK